MERSYPRRGASGREPPEDWRRSGGWRRDRMVWVSASAPMLASGLRWRRAGPPRPRGARLSRPRPDFSEKAVRWRALRRARTHFQGLQATVRSLFSRRRILFEHLGQRFVESFLLFLRASLRVQRVAGR